MAAALIAAPALEPVSLADVKAHLRLDGDAEDALLSAAITAARLQVEATTRRVLIEQGWRIYRDAWPAGGVVAIGIVPLVSVDEVTVYDAAGEPAVVDPDEYEIDAVSVPARLALKAGVTAPEKAVNGIEIDVTAGYGASSVDVPAPIRQTILMMVAHWYAHRGVVGYERAGNVVPLGVEALLAPYRVLSL